MPSASTFCLFALACLVLLAIPGPAVLYILAQSVEHGRRGGLAAMLGVHVGSMVHVAAAAFGLSAILASSAAAFDVVKYVGAAYLIVLGIRRLASRAHEPERMAPRRLDRVFRRGIVVNVLNPKTALFFLAFLPQFVDPNGAPVALQILSLGAVFVVLGCLSDGMYALLGGTAGEWFRRRPAAVRRERYVSGAVYIGLGVVTALTGHHRKS
jgi:threonine/homoserine/homoserine lactone efflux protein